MLNMQMGDPQHKASSFSEVKQAAVALLKEIQVKYNSNVRVDHDAVAQALSLTPSGAKVTLPVTTEVPDAMVADLQQPGYQIGWKMVVNGNRPYAEFSVSRRSAEGIATRCARFAVVIVALAAVSLSYVLLISQYGTWVPGLFAWIRDQTGVSMPNLFNIACVCGLLGLLYACYSCVRILCPPHPHKKKTD
jgi:hypothetical protein